MRDLGRKGLVTSDNIILGNSQNISKLENGDSYLKRITMNTNMLCKLVYVCKASVLILSVIG
jgi:hypothetical protein